MIIPTIWLLFHEDTNPILTLAEQSRRPAFFHILQIKQKSQRKNPHLSIGNYILHTTTTATTVMMRALIGDQVRNKRLE